MLTIETMKTTFTTAVLILIASLAMASVAVPSSAPMKLEEEAYVNDIPFDTWMISRLAFPPDLTLEEEEYVDDIPFNTAEVAKEALLNKVVGQAEEPSVDDIPFNTLQIYNEVLLSRFIADWQEEQNVNDIPFSTCVTHGSACGGRVITIICHDGCIIEVDNYLNDIGIHVRGLETLSFGYPF